MRADSCSIISNTVDRMPVIPVGKLSVLSDGRSYFDDVRVLDWLCGPCWAFMYVWITDCAMITRITRRNGVLRTRSDDDAGRKRSGKRQGFDDLGLVHFKFSVLPSFQKLRSAFRSQMFQLMFRLADGAYLRVPR